jgi:hypothetical protein
MKEKLESVRCRMARTAAGVVVWLKHRFNRATESVTPAMAVLSTVAVVGALSAVLAVLAIREYQR